MPLVQDGVVTLVALGAVAAIVRRLVVFARPRRGGETACGSCASNASRTSTRAASPAGQDAPDTHPVAFIRRRVH